MATATAKVLGQSAPLAVTETALYTVPAATQAIISSIVICNQGANATTFRLSVRVGGGVTAAQDYIAYEITIGAQDTITMTLGLTMAATDVLRCFTTVATVSFSAFGQEIA